MKNTIMVITVLLIFLIFLSCFPPEPFSARNYLQKTQSSLSVSANQTQTLILDPLGQQSTVQLTIAYTYGRFARPTGFPFPKRKTPTTINISVSKQPSWCLMSLERGSFEIPIQTFLLKKNLTQIMTVNLTMQCQDLSAQAHQESLLQFDVSAAENGNIQPCQTSFNLSIAPDYFLTYQVTSDSSSFIPLSYGEEKNTTLIFKNTGNCKTTFHLHSETLSDLLNISLNNQPDEAEFSLDLNEERSVTISLQSTKTVESPQGVTITLNVTAFATDAPTTQGPSKDIILQINLKAPENQKNTSPDITIYILYLAAFLIILPLVILVLIYRQKRIKSSKASKVIRVKTEITKGNYHVGHDAAKSKKY